MKGKRHQQKARLGENAVRAEVKSDSGATTRGKEEKCAMLTPYSCAVCNVFDLKTQLSIEEYLSGRRHARNAADDRGGTGLTCKLCGNVAKTW